MSPQLVAIAMNGGSLGGREQSRISPRLDNPATVYRFEYWGAFRAFRNPYFFRSLALGSRVR